jgi:tetratricopeptide (TPR) repeat protein
MSAQAKLATALRAALAALERGDAAAATAELDRAGRIAPAHPDLLHLRGMLAMRGGESDAAIGWFRRAVEVAPRTALYWNNLGYAYRAAGDLPQAEAALMRAIALQPGYGAAHNNLGATLASRAAYEAAAACFETAAALAGGAGGAYEDARFNHARAMLCLGRFERGWDDHRFRASRPGALEHQRLPADLSGMRLGLRGEQGIGDQIFFLRFAPLAAARGAELGFSGDPRLAGMLARAGIPPLLAAADRTLAVGDLPWALGCGDHDIPDPLRLPPQPERLREAMALIADLPRPVTGVAWRAGGVKGGDDTTKLVDPGRLGRALRAVGGTVVSVQRAARPDEQTAFAQGLGASVRDFSAVNGDLEAALALMATLDFLAGVSSANVHLRCGVGRVSDILVPFPMDWRWRGAADGSPPWYPGCSAYRQGSDGDWDRPLAALERSLAARAGAARAARMDPTA